MDNLILSLIPLGLAAAFQPPQVIAMLVLLQTKRGIINGLSFMIGMFFFRMVLGLGFWFFASSLEESVESTGGRFSFLVSGVLMVLGLLLLVNALRRAFSAPNEDQTASSWLENLKDVSPVRAGLVGIAFLALDPKDWVTDLAAVNLIADADLSGANSLMTYLIYLLMALSLLLIPLISILVFPKKAKRVLNRLSGWLEQHMRSIEIIMAIIFGLVFIGIGLGGLGLI